MAANTDSAVSKIWRLCHILRGDGVSYHEYISELTYLLFLKVAEENRTEVLLPEGRRWKDLAGYSGDSLLSFYREMLTYLGEHATSEVVRSIYAFPTTVFSHSENLRAVIDGLDKIEWHSLTMDRLGDIYEGLLSKNSQDIRSGAGQYFTPRPLVDSIVKLVKPSLGDVIQDPATGTGGFLISADQHVRSNSTANEYESHKPRYEGIEIEKGAYRLCLMNTFLHRLECRMILGDALTVDSEKLALADVILANPPFGAKAGSAREQRRDLTHATTNKQLAFLQHIYLGLKPGGRAAVVLPDNVLFEDGTGRKIRKELMDRCNLHTILRLPPGIFYSPGVMTNVLFFTRGESDAGNTEQVWIYDMRHNSPKIGKKRPLKPEDFHEFETEYGEDALGGGIRRDQGAQSPWRCFDRQFIADRSDNLDITWLADRRDGDVPSEPEEISEAIRAHLLAALSEIEAVTQEFSEVITSEV